MTDRRREGTFWLAVFAGLTVLYQVVLGWQGWMRLLAVACALAGTLVLMFLAGFARGFLRDTLPRRVPADLAETHLRLERAGWRDTRVHPWWKCEEERPHTHMVLDEDKSRTPLILVWDGTTYLDAAGNILRHEP